MKNKLNYGLLETRLYPDEEVEIKVEEGEEGEEAPKREKITAPCSDPKCKRHIIEGELMYMDINNSSMFCDNCGKCLRYARKKAHQRGELDLQGRSITE